MYCKTTMYSFVDFRKTPAYQHYKLKFPGTDDHILVLRDMYSSSPSWWSAKKDVPRWLIDDISHYVEKSADIKSLSHRLQLCDGIYDIWVKDMTNCTDIYVDVDGIGQVFHATINMEETNQFQIPLAFHTDGEPVTNFMLDTTNKPCRTSFIPVYAFNKNNIHIRFNDGGAGTVTLSTVYFPRMLRESLLFKTHEFYIGGMPILYSHTQGFYIKYKHRTILQRMWDWMFPVV